MLETSDVYNSVSPSARAKSFQKKIIPRPNTGAAPSVIAKLEVSAQYQLYWVEIQCE